MLDDLHARPARVGPGGPIEDGQPDVVARHHDDDGDQENGQLLGDGAVPAQLEEGGGDEEGQDGDDDPLHDVQHDVLELLQDGGDGLGLGPHSGQTDQDREDQGAHHRHDLGDGQLKGHRQAGALRGGGGEVQIGDEGIAGAHGHEGGQHRADIGDDDGYRQQPGSVGAQLGDGRGDEADDDQGDAEVDQLSQDVLGGADDVDHCAGKGQRALLGDEQAQRRPHDHTDQQLQRQVLRLFHDALLSFHNTT